MSYQGTEWARRIPGNCGEKNVLAQLGHRLDQRTNRARVSEKELARDTGLSVRQVRHILRQLEKRGVVTRTGGVGSGNVTEYSFVGFEGFECVKADILGLKSRHSRPEKRTFATAKADIRDTRTNGVRAQEEEPKKLQEENQNITPHGALTFWLKFKDQLKTELPDEDWSAWLRPLFFLKELGSKHLLLALPPDSRVVEAYKAKEPWLRERLGSLGYCCSATKYPDEFELDKAIERNPEWAEVRDRLLRTKKQPQRATA